MTDNQTGEVSEQADAPAEEVPASESTREVADQQPPEVTEGPEPETGKNEDGEDAPKENAAWAKMRAENKRLKDALEETDPEYLESLRGAVGRQELPPQQFRPMADDADYSEVTQRLNWAQQQTLRANEQIGRLQNQLELQQDRMAEEAFPELKTDKVFQQLVAEKKLAARVLGRDVTTLDIARDVNRILSKRDEQVTAQTVETTKKQVAEKQAAVAEARGTTSGGVSARSNEEIRKRLRKGDADAQTQVAHDIIADLEF